MKPGHRYSGWWVWLVRRLPVAFVAVGVAQVALTGARLLVALIERRVPLPLSDFWRLPGEPWAAVPASLATLALLLALAVIWANLAMPLTVTHDGVRFYPLHGSRFVPWAGIAGFSATRAGPPIGDLLFLRTSKGAPWYSRLYGLVAGVGFAPGFLVTSALEGFQPAMGEVLRTLEAERGVESVPFEEQGATPFLAMLAEPDRRLAALWPKDESGRSLAPLPDRAVLRRAAQRAAVVALALPLVVLLDGIGALELRPSALVLFVLGLIEWPVAAAWLDAIADLGTQRVSWRDVLAIYPETQAPRWVVVPVCLVLALLGAPWWLLMMPAAAGMLWSGRLVALLTRRLYDTGEARSWLGGAVPLLYQVLLYGLMVYSVG